MTLRRQCSLVFNKYFIRVYYSAIHYRSSIKKTIKTWGVITCSFGAVFVRNIERSVRFAYFAPTHFKILPLPLKPLYSNVSKNRPVMDPQPHPRDTFLSNHGESTDFTPFSPLRWILHWSRRHQFCVNSYGCTIIALYIDIVVSHAAYHGNVQNSTWVHTSAYSHSPLLVMPRC